MSTHQDKQAVALSSVWASAGLTVMKLITGLMTGSMGIISEAVHSALDLGAAALTYFAVRVGDKPPDADHPYGHGKVESVSALIETGLLFVTSAWIIKEAGHRLWTGSAHDVEPSWYAFAVMGVSIIVDLSRSRALTRVAVATHSQALEADALHFSSDVLSSTVVILGLLGVSLGYGKADALAAIGVAGFVIHAGWSLGKRTIDVLVDAAPEGLADQVKAEAERVDGVIGVENIRVRPAGPGVIVDLVVTVSRRLPVGRAEAIARDVERKIGDALPATDITVRTKPLSLDTETIVEQVHIVAGQHDLSVHDVVVHSQREKKYVSFDLEVDANLTLKEAHRIASHLEEALTAEIGGDVEINTHIEPQTAAVLAGQKLRAAEERRVIGVIGDVAASLKMVKHVHDIHVRQTAGKLFISLHCGFEEDLPLEDVHRTASRFEYLVREQLPATQRVVVHTEPLEEALK